MSAMSDYQTSLQKGYNLFKKNCIFFHNSEASIVYKSFKSYVSVSFALMIPFINASIKWIIKIHQNQSLPIPHYFKNISQISAIRNIGLGILLGSIFIAPNMKGGSTEKLNSIHKIQHGAFLGGMYSAILEITTLILSSKAYFSFIDSYSNFFDFLANKIVSFLSTFMTTTLKTIPRVSKILMSPTGIASICVIGAGYYLYKAYREK